MYNDMDMNTEKENCMEVELVLSGGGGVLHGSYVYLLGDQVQFRQDLIAGSSNPCFNS